MTNVNITSFRKDIFNHVENTIRFNTPINVSTKVGNVIVMSEDDYKSLMETLFFESRPELKKAILESVNSSKNEGTKLGNRTLKQFIDEECR